MRYSYNWGHLTVAHVLWCLVIADSSAYQDSSHLRPVVAPRLFSITHLHEPGTTSRWNQGNSRQLETQMMRFVWERHSKNQLNGRSDGVDVFYDSIGGTDIIDAWIARLTDEDIIQFQKNFLGLLISASDYDAYEKQGSLRKRAGNDSCERIPLTDSTSTMMDIPVDSSIPDVAATEGSSDEARLCLDECRSIFTKCGVDYDPIAEDRRRDVLLIDCQAAGNCYCTETPWRTGSPLAIDFDKADKACSETCNAIGQGTQVRRISGSDYSFEDLGNCLEQAKGGKSPEEAQPAGCMGA